MKVSAFPNAFGRSSEAQDLALESAASVLEALRGMGYQYALVQLNPQPEVADGGDN